VSHTYADADQFKDYLVSDGGTDFGTTDDAAMLRVLEGASRRVDAYCGRSSFGSGFGPRVASNVYDHDGGQYLDLYDDFLAVTSVTSASTTGATQVALTVNTDYLKVPYAAPHRALVFPGLGSGTIGSGYQVFTVAGTAGYAAETESVGACGTATTSATSLTLTSGSAYPGATLLIDSEQVYVTASSGGTALTITRAVNGTTAATHGTASTVSRYRYDRAVELATLRVAQRAWRAKEAGVTGDFGGGDIAVTGNRDTERSILRETVGHLRVYTVG
jgi:hypothetical protein